MTMLRFATTRSAVPLMLVAAFALAAVPAAGQEENAAEDPEAVRPFTIDVPDEVLADLKDRLSRTRLPDDLVGTEWDYGTNREYLEELLAYWRDDFSWRDQEWLLNGFDHFKIDIDGLDVHFIHQRSPHEDALPLVITHGWPGSIMEFYKIIPLLADPTNYGGDAADAFHVVAPSIPGYGFSDKPTGRGYGPEKMAEIIGKLMERLGYDRYGTQGGDWGSIISRWQAVQHPDRVVGVHLNMVTAGPPAGVDDPTAGVPPEELARTPGAAGVLRRRARLQQHPGNEAADPRLRPERLAGRAGRLDRGEVPHLVRLRRRRREPVLEGRAADEHHDLLGDPDHHVVDPHLLRVAARDQPAGLRRDAGGRRHLPERAVHPAAGMGGGGIQRDPLGGNAPRRSFRSARGAGAADRRHPGVLPEAAMTLHASRGAGARPQR